MSQAEPGAPSPQPSPRGRGSLPKSLTALLAAAAAIALVLALRQAMPVGYDWFHYYYPTARAWLSGESRLYDAATAGFYSPPWTVWLLAPLAVFDLRTGMAALTLASVAAIVGVALVHARASGAGRPGLVAALVVLCPYTLQVVLVGSLDGLSLLGLYVAYRCLLRDRRAGFGAALVLAAIRPQNLVLTAPVLVVLAYRRWGAAGLLRAAAVPAGVLLACAAAFGPDWPLRWYEAWRAYPPIPYLVTSTYAATNLAGVPAALVAAGMVALAAHVLWSAWRAGALPKSPSPLVGEGRGEGVSGAPRARQLISVFDLAVAVNAAVSPYMLSQSFSVLLALPWAGLAARRPRSAAALYLLSLPLLLRAGGLWDRIGLIDVCFPLLLSAVLLADVARQPAQQQVEREGQDNKTG